MNLAGKIALVTGAGRGIGRGIAEVFAEQGADVAINDIEITPEGASSVVEWIRSKGRRAIAVQADVSDRVAVESMFEKAWIEFGHIDILVNNAGFGQYGEFHTVETQRLLEMAQVNCAAVLHLTRLYLPAMVAKRRGNVLIVASTAAFQAVPYISTYAATKVFDLYLAEGLAEEMRPYGIRVCALCPGTTASEFHDVAGHPDHSRGPQQSAETVARNGLKALAAGRSYVISGMGNYLGAHAQRLIPRRLVTRIAAKLFRQSAP